MSSIHNRRNQRKFRKNCLIVSITFTPSIFTDFLIKIVNTTTCLPLANRKLSNLLKIQRPLWILSSTIVDKFLESILEPRDKTPLISKLFRHGTQDAKLVKKIFLCFMVIHNGENDSHKRQFLALRVHSQSWILDNLSKKFLSN